MQPIAKPGYLQTITDPSFGTTIRRITDAGSCNIIKPMYSTIQAWNADESLMILYQQGQGHLLLNGITCACMLIWLSLLLRDPNGGCIGDVIAHNLTNGSCFTLTNEDQSYKYSQSGTNISALSHKNTQNGWLAASMVGCDEDGQSLLDQELIIARADQNNIQVCRIGHHRSDENEFDYWGEPHAVISPTGTRVLFGSDWSGSEDGPSENAVTPGNIKVDATFEHIVILYNINDGENLNSNLQIEFREQDNGAYKDGAITMRSHTQV